MRRTAVAILAALLCPIGLVTVASPASAAPGDVAIGTFISHNVVGSSKFTEGVATITVTGSYARLRPHHAYFTVIYGDNNCDPVAAFPIGPFWTNGYGSGHINMTVANPNGISVGATMSVSVRRGDNQTDIDHDGKIGPTDVVAVPGMPSIGLINCDYHPAVIGA